MDAAQLLTVEVGDEPSAWAELGFTVDEQGCCRIGDLVVRLVGASGARGLLAWSAGPGIEGIAGCAEAAAVAMAHANGVTATDHVVVMTPNCDRSTAGFEAAGFPARRTRTFQTGTRTTRQTFHWVRGTILEVVGDHEQAGDGPARLWGLAFTSDDFDLTTSALADQITTPKDAVQPGRRIASLRREVDAVSVPVAFMSAHVRT